MQDVNLNYTMQNDAGFCVWIEIKIYWKMLFER